MPRGETHPPTPTRALCRPGPPPPPARPGRPRCGDLRAPRPARIPRAEQLGRLVDRLPRRIVLRLPEEPVAPDAIEGRLAADSASAILLDLNHRSGKAIASLEKLKNDPATRSIPVVAFLSHVQTDLAQAARAAGCDRVMARSAFSQQLQALLRELAEQ